MKTFLAMLLIATTSLAQTTDLINGLMTKANSGDAHAQAVLGRHYQFGFLVKKDEAAAQSLYEKSAQSGNPLGLVYLGVFTEWGTGSLTKDKQKAQQLYRKALDAGLLDLAQGGDSHAQDAYGDMLKWGDGGLTENPQEGVAWRQRAADAGNPFAQYWVGYLSWRGDVKKDIVAALKYFKMAAAQNFPEAKEYVALLSWDEAAAKARAAEQKVNTLVVKGLWLGMPIEDACQTINHKVGSLLLSVTTDEKSKLKTIILSKTIMGVPTSKHVEVLADESGKVTSLLLSKDVLDALFDSKDMPRDEFLQTFINAYSIPELKSDMRELKAGFMGATSTIGFQQVYSYRSPKGFEVTFFGEPRLEDEGGAMQARMLGMADYGEAGSMLLKKIATAKARESKFD